MAEKPPKQPTKPTEPKGAESVTVDVFYDKSAQHRTIFADGIWAGITPSLELQLVFFKNLSPVPEYTRIEVMPNDKLGGELDKVVKKGMVREYEATVVMSRETAQAMIGLMQRIMDQIPEKQKTTPVKT